MMEDEKIVDLFFERSEEAIKEIDLKYGRVCHKISFNILNNRLDAEECVNDAYLGVWDAIPPKKPESLIAFLCKIVRNVSLKRYEYNSAAKRNAIYDVAMSELEDCLASVYTMEEENDRKELIGIIEEFLDTLSVENRVIFMRRYWFSDTYSDIARQVGISEKNVSVRLTRVRGKMREYLLKKGVVI